VRMLVMAGSHVEPDWLASEKIRGNAQMMRALAL